MKRVNFLCLAVLGLFFASCHSNDDTWGDWSRASSFKGLNRTGAVTFTIGDVVYVGLGVNKDKVNDTDKTLRDFWKLEKGAWSPVDSFPKAAKGRIGAVAFVVNNIAYVGTGYRDSYFQNDSKEYFKDFYAFDPSKPAGLQWSGPVAAGFPGEPRQDGVAFSINGKGYVGTGVADGARTLGDFYSYDPVANKWDNINFPGDSRCGAVAFVLDGKAVVCLGAASSNGSGNYVFDVGIYDPVKNEWLEGIAPLVDRDGRGWDNDYNKIPRAYAIAFTSSLIDGTERGYIATGSGSYGRTCWEYNIQTDRWDEVTELPSAMQSRAYAVGFSLNNYGYVTTGGTSSGTAIGTETWKFTPGIDEDDDNDYAPGN